MCLWEVSSLSTARQMLTALPFNTMCSEALAAELGRMLDWVGVPALCCAVPSEFFPPHSWGPLAGVNSTLFTGVLGYCSPCAFCTRVLAE